jgi:hypothetical protein
VINAYNPNILQNEVGPFHNCKFISLFTLLGFPDHRKIVAHARHKRRVETGLGVGIYCATFVAYPCIRSQMILRVRVGV